MNEQNYRIGLTTQITGIRPETLRAWERRSSVVKPIRTEAGDRLYTQADIDRLLLIKRLVDNGDAISAVANLSHDTLKERIDNCRTAIASDKKGKLAFVLLGSTILDKNTLDQMNLNMIDVKTDAAELKSSYHTNVNFVNRSELYRSVNLNPPTCLGMQVVGSNNLQHQQCCKLLEPATCMLEGVSM